MIEPMIAKTKHAAGTAGIGVVAALALSVGLVFWTLAAWLFLLTQTTPLLAAVILAAVYTGAGLIGLAVVSARKKQKVVHRPTVPPATVDNLMAAFISGVKAGAGTRR
jgi:archaellum biogenesis protein FlaJ (TadC family)